MGVIIHITGIVIIETIMHGLTTLTYRARSTAAIRR